MMNGLEKSDSAIVAVKPANKAAQAVAAPRANMTCCTYPLTIQ